MSLVSSRWSARAAVALLASVPSTALAQSEGFAINRFDPAERGSDWFAADSLDLRGHGRLMLGVTGDYAHKPLVLYNRDGDELRSIIEHQLFAHVGASLVLWDRLRLGASLPVLASQKGEPASVNGVPFRAEEGAAVGDLRLAADVRLLGEYRSPFSLAGGVAVFAPTGKQESFAGDGKVRILPRLLLAGDIGNFAYAAKLGVLYRANDSGFNGSPQGTEAVVAAAIGYRSDSGKLVLGPEVFGSTVVADGDAFFSRRSTPLEVIFGAHYKVTDDVRIGAGFGPGLTRGFGSPQFRGLLSLEWAPEPAKEPLVLPPAPEKDRDGDGVLDKDDACPDTPGEKNEDPAKNGCPPGDRDRDGILDKDDACPDEPGIKSEDPQKHGCPRPDTDKDGIFDDEDACVNEAGVRTTDPVTNGCPLPKDTDKDTIIDPEDACPTAPGPRDTDPKKNGCPAARVEQGQIKILERVEFENNSSKLRPESTRILEAVLAVMTEHTELTKLSVEGHTDNRGAANHNLDLSRRRAAAVMKWLTDHGITKDRLSSQGLGMTKPIDTNETDAGRQNNRRVEFHILEKDGKPLSE
ncbi:MAG: Outer rane lipoprotein omp16 precursor [Polyangiaceae bacterium]|jgi:outer membrane protein OmpA-like peptidoglycan-associated protein|nr:Outer rane lipoprotein omp16 precursor [Polyangiaceae bacterium]